MPLHVKWSDGRMQVKQRQDEQIQQSVDALKKGGLIAYPTEAVFGLGCDPRNEAALKRLLQLKERDIEKGFILIAANYEQLKPFLLALDKTTESELLASWPGPVTWLVPANETVNISLRGAHTTLAVRVTDHPIVQQLCLAFGGAIVSTSANPAGKNPAKNVKQVKGYFNNALDVIIDGQTGDLNKPTQIRDALSKQVLR